MPIFYPPVDFDEPPRIEKGGDLAEWTVLEALRSLDRAWRVFHGIEWRSVSKYGEQIGEADLILFHPDLGILVAEIKSGGVRLEGGVWFHGNPHDDSSDLPMKMSPFGQARRSHFHFLTRLKNTPLGRGILNDTAFTHTAWFPDFEWTGALPPDFPSGAFLLDSRHLSNPEKHLRNILTQSHPDAKPWTQREADILIRSIAPEVYLTPPLGGVLGAIRERLLRMTEGQIRALGIVRTMKRLLVEGCAGSGKTLLAVRLAHDHLQQGKRVLFTCFNKNLAIHLATEFEGYENIDVINFHELVRVKCEQSRIPYEVPDDRELLPDFFRNSCLDLLMQATERDAVRYDTIIVDEGLDFLETWWIALEGLGVEDCSFYAFYDTRQAIFTEKAEWQPPFSCEPIRLEMNVRNTRPVGQLANRLGELNEEHLYAVNDGPESVTVSYETVAEQVEKIREIIQELIGRRKVAPEEIVVLSPYKHTSDRVGLQCLIEENPKLFCTEMVRCADGRVRVGTIQSFKGLEADVVILCGVDGNLPACKPANLYVGASRARSLLYVIHHTDMSL
jgi:DNA polymerase III delta prime subunit